MLGEGMKLHMENIFHNSKIVQSNKQDPGIGWAEKLQSIDLSRGFPGPILGYNISEKLYPVSFS